MAPFIGGWRTVQDFPVRLKKFSFLFREKFEPLKLLWYRFVFVSTIVSY